MPNVVYSIMYKCNTNLLACTLDISQKSKFVRKTFSEIRKILVKIIRYLTK